MFPLNYKLILPSVNSSFFERLPHQNSVFSSCFSISHARAVKWLAMSYGNGIRYRVGAEIFFSSPPHSDRCWSPPHTLISNAYWEFSPTKKRPEREYENSPPSSVGIECAVPYLQSHTSAQTTLVFLRRICLAPKTSYKFPNLELSYVEVC
jgi:hypothetical protein